MSKQNLQAFFKAFHKNVLNKSKSNKERKNLTGLLIAEWENNLPEVFVAFVKRYVVKNGHKEGIDLLRDKLHKYWIHKASPTICLECRNIIPLKNTLRESPHKFCSNSCGGKSKLTRNKARETNLALRGVEYPTQSSEVMKKHAIGIKKVFGNKKRRSQIAKKTKATNLERRGVEFPMQSKEVQRKSRITCKQNYGVEHPLQNAALHQKALKTSGKLYTGRCKGQRFTVQGKSEIKVLKYLVDKYGVKNVLTQFSDDYPKDSYARMKTFPDFYIKSKDLFVECKSIWTFMGRGLDHLAAGEGDLAKNKRKAKTANKAAKVLWVIQKKDGSTYELPMKWYTKSDTGLRNMVDAL